MSSVEKKMVLYGSISNSIAASTIKGFVCNVTCVAEIVGQVIPPASIEKNIDQ